MNIDVPESKYNGEILHRNLIDDLYLTSYTVRKKESIIDKRHVPLYVGTGENVIGITSNVILKTVFLLLYPGRPL